MGNDKRSSDPKSYRTVRQRAIDYLNVCNRLYCFDGFAGGPEVPDKDPCHLFEAVSRAFHAYDADPGHGRGTLVFGQPDFVIYNAGVFPADRLMAGSGRRPASASILKTRNS